MPDEMNAALAILRIVLGVVFLAHGIKHARGRVKTTDWFDSIGFKNAEFQWFAMTATEVGVGILLIAGLLTGFVAAGVIGTMFVAYWTVHRTVGFWVTARPDEGYEYIMTLAAVALALALAGPGQWSIDGAIGIADSLDGWVGAALAGLGLAAGAGQVALFLRPRAPVEAG